MISRLYITLSIVIVLLIPLAIATDYYVSPTGEDTNRGTTDTQPLATIQEAVNLAQPGDTVHLTEGTYFQDIETVRDGTPNAPITITGPPEAIVYGGGEYRITQIYHDYITLDGFTIDGEYETGSYRGKLIYAVGIDAFNGVEGVKIQNMVLRNAQDECVRLRYFATDNEIAYNTITNCGYEDFQWTDQCIEEGDNKNGEGIYIGTSPEQWGTYGAPTADADASTNNWVHHNTIDTQGNECIEIKESSSGNIVEYNTCTGQKDTEAAGLNGRGNNNVFRYNTVFENCGAGIRVGGDTTSDGIKNNIYENTIWGNLGGGIKFQAIPQGLVCGNSFEDNTGGDAVGKYKEEFTPTEPCTEPLGSETEEEETDDERETEVISSPSETISGEETSSTKEESLQTNDSVQVIIVPHEKDKEGFFSTIQRFLADLFARIFS